MRTGHRQKSFPGDRGRRHGSSRSAARSNEWGILLQRDEYDPGVYLDQHVSKAVGSVGDSLYGAFVAACRSCDLATQEKESTRKGVSYRERSATVIDRRYRRISFRSTLMAEPSAMKVERGGAAKVSANCSP